jgi:hypothetical protein
MARSGRCTTIILYDSNMIHASLGNGEPLDFEYRVVDGTERHRHCQSWIEVQVVCMMRGLNLSLEPPLQVDECAWQ